MGMLRKCYTTQVQPFFDSDETITIRWQWCQPGATPLPFAGKSLPAGGLVPSLYQRFSNGSFPPTEGAIGEGVGEVTGTWKFTRGYVSPLSGVGPVHGSEQDWAEGLSIDEPIQPVMICELRPFRRRRRLRGVITQPYGPGLRVGVGYLLPYPYGPGLRVGVGYLMPYPYGPGLRVGVGYRLPPDLEVELRVGPGGNPLLGPIPDLEVELRVGPGGNPFGVPRVDLETELRVGVGYQVPSRYGPGLRVGPGGAPPVDMEVELSLGIGGRPQGVPHVDMETELRVGVGYQVPSRYGPGLRVGPGGRPISDTEVGLRVGPGGYGGPVDPYGPGLEVGVIFGL